MESPFYEMSQEFFDDANRQFENGYARIVSRTLENKIAFAESYNQNTLLVTLDVLKDILALLKEQEKVEPEVEVTNEIDRLYKCPKCHGYLFYDGQKYCDRCGQAVKWNE